MIVQSGCGSGEDPIRFLGTSESPIVGEGEPEYQPEYQIETEAVVAEDFQTVTVQGQVVTGTGTQGPGSPALHRSPALQGSPALHGSLALQGGTPPFSLVVKRLASATVGEESRPVQTDAAGRFAVSFEVGTQESDSFEVSLEGSPESAVTVEVDLTGVWQGTFSLEERTGSCERIPAEVELNVPVRVDQSGKSFSIQLGGALQIDGLLASVDGDLAVSGQGTDELSPGLSESVGCFDLVAYEFSGGIERDGEGLAFDATFAATLSGRRAGCEPASAGETCLLTGWVTGTRD